MPSKFGLSFKGFQIAFGASIIALQLVLYHRLQSQATARDQTSAQMHRPTFTLFGDSLTQHSFSEGGWGAKLADAYSRKADVVLRGFSGYNTAWAQYLVQKVFPPQNTSVKSALVTIFFGANDAALAEGVNARQHVPLAAYAANLKRLVGHVQASGANTIVLITPPPIDEAARRISRIEKWGYDETSERPDRTNVVTGQYAAACRDVAAQLGLPVLDTWSEFQKAENWRTYLSDGLHLTPKGNEALFKLLVQLIDSQLPRLRYDGMSFDFPLHDAISAEDPSAAFRQQ